MSDLEPKVVSALDQFSGVVAQVGEMTVAHYQRLVDGRLPPALADTLTSDMHDALIGLFVSPPDPEPKENEEL